MELLGQEIILVQGGTSGHGNVFALSNLQFCFNIQNGDRKRNPDMDRSAALAGTGCMAVSPISGLRFMSSHCVFPHPC